MQLILQIKQLQTKMLDYQSKAQEILRLRALLKFPYKERDLVLAADVVVVTQRNSFNIIRINRSRSDGVKIGMPVIAAEGLVGRVIRVGTLFSDVQALGDTTFSLDVVVERTRERGLLQGVSFGQCQLKLHRRSDIRIGDEVVSSGMAGGFPKGIPVGKVIKVSIFKINKRNINGYTFR